MRSRLPYSSLNSEDAATAIEYALLGAFIAAIIISSVNLVGNQVFEIWRIIENCVITFSLKI